MTDIESSHIIAAAKRKYPGRGVNTTYCSGSTYIRVDIPGDGLLPPERYTEPVTPMSAPKPPIR